MNQPVVDDNPEQKKTHFSIIFFVLLIICIINTEISAQQLAFPGAEGHGKFTTGGRGGIVIEVTNLNDNGPGSLREAINQPGIRTIVFKISGTIYLNSTLTINNGNLTIAGQTAPGDGICIAGYPVRINADNIIIRYLRFRLGDINAVEDDAIWGREISDIIIDHCSMSWSTDECASFYDNSNFTLQWCILSESLYYSVHAKGAHGYGGIWGGMKASFLNNLFAHHTSRNPRFNGSRYSRQPDAEIVDYANNVIFNWGFNNAYGGEGGNYNLRNNYYKSGPATVSSVANRILDPDSGPDGYAKWFIEGNYVEGYPEATADNWGIGVHNILPETKEQIKSDTLFDFAGYSAVTAEDAYLKVLENAGAILPRRDAVDTRIVSDVMSGEVNFGTGRYNEDRGFGDTPTGIIDSQEDVAGWPGLYTGPVPADSDHDGMPDEWELANSFNPNVPDDKNNIEENGYTALENYLNSITEFPLFLPAPKNVTAELTAGTTIKLSWDDETDNETGFRIERAEEDDSSFINAGEVEANITTYTDSGLAELTEYRYRIIAFNDSLESGYEEIVEITTLSSTSPPLAVKNPFPANGETYVVISPVLKWDESINADSYDIYFGSTNTPDFIGNQPTNTYSPGKLTQGEKYFWRINAVNNNGTTEGSLWNFTVKPDMPSGQVAFWKLDETDGETAADAGEFGLDGILINTDPSAWTEGKINGGLKFDGIDDHILVEHNGIIDFSWESFSVAAWFKAEPLTDASMYIIHKGSFVRNPGSNNTGKWYGIEIKNNELRFAIDDDIVKTQATVLNIDTLLSDKWAHIAGIRDTAEGLLKVYVNGKMLASFPDETGNISQEENLFLGNNYNLTAPLSGVLDEVMIFNYALSESEVKSIYDNITDIEKEISIPQEFILHQNYPNPFNPVTTIRFSIPAVEKHLPAGRQSRNASLQVSLKVYDVLGREIITLVNEEKTAGNYAVSFDASSLASGIYFYSINAGNFKLTRKMVLAK